MAGVTNYRRPLIFLLAMLEVMASAVAQSPTTFLGCTGSLLNLSPCVSYITNNVTTSPPPEGCCSALSSVIEPSSECLCQLFVATNPLGIPVNRLRSLTVPGACNIITPSLIQCKAEDTLAPSLAPSPSTESGPAPSAVSPSADLQPSSFPPTSSVGGISPTGDSDNNPAINAAGTHFRTSRILVLFAGVALICIVL